MPTGQPGAASANFPSTPSPIDATIPPLAPGAPFLGFVGDIVRWGESLPGTPMFLWMLAGFVGMLVGLPTILAILSVLGIANRPAAQLIATRDCRWTDATAAIPSGSELRPGAKIDLASGEAQIAFARGAIVSLHGPGVIEVLSDNSARLLLGKLAAWAETEKSRASPFARRQ